MKIPECPLGNLKSLPRFGGVFIAVETRPLLAESGHQFCGFDAGLNVRFREKQTFRLSLEKSGRRVTALPPNDHSRNIAVNDR